MDLYYDIVNNLGSILKFFGVLFAPSFIFSIIQYRKNKKFEKLHNNKELEIKEAELIAEEISYQSELNFTPFYMGNDWRQKEINHNLRVLKLKSEINFLKNVLNKKEK